MKHPVPGVPGLEWGQAEAGIAPGEWARLRERLQGSAFRSRFGLHAPERDYAHRIGAVRLLDQLRNFLLERLAMAHPPSDGRQTPMRGHVVFIAQHATATCCRTCLARWHGIPQGRPLTEPEFARIVGVLARWLSGKGLWESGWGAESDQALPDPPPRPKAEGLLFDPDPPAGAPRPGTRDL